MSEIPDEAFDKTMNSNLRSNHWLCQMVAPDMLEKGRGAMMTPVSERLVRCRMTGDLQYF